MIWVSASAATWARWVTTHHLVASPEPGERLGHRRCRGAADAGVDLVEDSVSGARSTPVAERASCGPARRRWPRVTAAATASPGWRRSGSDVVAGRLIADGDSTSACGIASERTTSRPLPPTSTRRRGGLGDRSAAARSAATATSRRCSSRRHVGRSSRALRDGRWPRRGRR